MALNYTPQTVQSGYQSTETLNQNFSDIEEALADGLSRSGASPNAMAADIDMQANRIFNLPNAVSNGEPVTYQQLISQFAGAVEFTGYLQELQVAEEGQTSFTLGNQYTPGLGALRVFVNGLHYPPSEYSEVDEETVLFSAAMTEGDEVAFIITSFSEANYDTAATVTYTDIDNNNTNLQVYIDALAGDVLQYYDATDGNILVGNGTTFVEESGATARASLGLTIGTNVQAYDADLTTLGSPGSMSELDASTLAADDLLVVYDTSGTAYKKIQLQSVGARIQAASTQTLALDDGNSLFVNTGASTYTITVPPNSSVAFPVGTELGFLCQSTGKITLAQGSGVTITSLSSYKSVKASGGAAYLVKTATNTWHLAGDLEA
jgi:hypothetical protein